MDETAPNLSYDTAYDALQRRIRQQYAGQRAGLNQALASRQVQGSGVAIAPIASLGAQEAGAMGQGAGQIGLQQSSDAVARRYQGEDYAQQMYMLQNDNERRNALARRLGQNQLTAMGISGGINAISSLGYGSLQGGA